MNAGNQIVFVVDDDILIREIVSAVASPGKRHVAAFGCAGEYIAFAKPDADSELKLIMHKQRQITRTQILRMQIISGTI